MFTQLIYFSPFRLIGLPFGSAWAVSDSHLLPGRSVILTQVSASAGQWLARPLHTHTQIVTDHGSHDLTAFPLLSVRLILLLWFLQHSPPLPFCFFFFFFSISEENGVAQAVFSSSSATWHLSCSLPAVLRINKYCVKCVGSLIHHPAGFLVCRLRREQACVYGGSSCGGGNREHWMKGLF